MRNIDRIIWPIAVLLSLTACGKTIDWKQEVKLHDGKVIVVDRQSKQESMSIPTKGILEPWQQIAFTHPASGERIVWDLPKGGANAIYAGVGADWITAGNGNDELFGGAEADFLQGDAGNGVSDGADTLDGEAGDDILLGADSASTTEDAAPIAGNLLANNTDVDAGTVLTIQSRHADRRLRHAESRRRRRLELQPGECVAPPTQAPGGCPPDGLSLWCYIFRSD
ncbi:MAG: hypothetical protein Q8O52_12920 [Sulfuritalea sp.]|nr:hypothetical protein [Sulfuritalea sp.]